MADILVVDDDEQICSALEQFLRAEGHRPLVASNAQDAFSIVARSDPDLVLLDIRMPGVGGLQALEKLRRMAPEVPVVMMTAYGTSGSSIEAMRLGAFDYVMKPFEAPAIKSILDRALEARALSRKIPRPAEPAGDDVGPIRLVGKSPAMQEVYKLIGLLTARGIPALIIGERGVGKNLVADTIHASGERKSLPLARVSCRALPEEQLAVELFGRESGEDGGVAARGKLEIARGGTLLVEHVEELALPLQARLVRFLRDHTFERIGGIRPVRSDVHVIAATERDLGDRVRRGTFSEKLFDRLRAFSIKLPPLRDRREDLPDLTAHLVERCNRELDLAIKGVDERVERLFRDYPWPGNVGELETVILRAAALARGDVITPEDLGDSLEEGWFVGREEAESGLDMAVRRAWRQRMAAAEGEPGDSPFHQLVARVEKVLVREALAETSGNQVQAARLLGVTRTTLRAKIDRYEL